MYFRVFEHMPPAEVRLWRSFDSAADFNPVWWCGQTYTSAGCRDLRYSLIL
ncbi:hypothetical protein MA6G0728R_0337 [Mycobacteroides abscessus 6G-0728-R]|nr:hypothetical protein MA6G0125R_4608 [Mycobacteroides abscessus 6G-0125-R]EIU51516.1 hypothetical protein MA6G0125S_0340 [Mycobacteroides abscessus 6G-0125-S]EIU56933.1 hypothetical protein MA6G0728S_1965 [Mycobacteroides abscessus 6G-0728-S]EIV02343.1 hypothetical protein MA6G0728R_0337 [Mycobacteroides abscessus 6G-0728-R]EIV58184.1 hypothetical protein MA3A0930S_0389 [Mycobacteroides abscessus 3A-0930-S]EUA73120.1 hypothetical protein I541_5330 [Mycobacteroides abscessus]EUA81742.1 hypot